MTELIHKGTSIIETERFILRPFKRKDGADMYKNWASDPNVARYVTWEAHQNAEKSEYICGLWEDESKNSDNYYNWAIKLKLSGEIVGGISVVSHDDKKRIATIGYCCSALIWNTGCMTECFKAVIKYLFEEIGFNRIEACHDTANPASGKVMAKCGLKFEGVSRQAIINKKGEFADLANYAILKCDYDSRMFNENK